MGDAIESAVIALTMTGADAASRQADRVTVDLSSAKRAGASAEASSKAAEQAAKSAKNASASLETAAERALSKLSVAGRVGSHLDGLLGGAGSVLGELGTGARVAEHVISLLSGFIPGGGLVVGGLSAAAGIYAATQRADRDDSKDERQAERIAKHLSEFQQDDLQAAMLQQVGLSKLDRAVSR